jgi:hypothetical protein
VGSVFALGYHSVVFMDNGNQADRVNNYLAWRTTRAIEGVEMVLNSIFYMLFLMYAVLLISYLWPRGER